ncbi:MAG: ABC transporter permease, partial [Desulfobacterales bacterium]|nr:ABC transporter permease [Desulfobacterales bacterium]
LVIPTMFLVSLIIFFVMRILPGNIIDVLSAGDIEIDRAMLERQLGLDVPQIVQYGRWLGVAPQADGGFSGVFQGALGDSWWRGLPVVDLLASAWPVTLELAVMGLITAQLIALPIGVYSALRQDEWGDYIGRTFAILCVSVPGFWLGTLVIVFPGLWWGYMPPIMLVPFTENPIGNLQMFIVPAIILAMALTGVTMRMTRTMMLEVLRQDYIRTAWAKGLGERVVVLRHTLKNALIPVITIIGLQVPFLLGGTVIIERIFVLPGMGRLIIDGVQHRDCPLINGIMLLLAVILVLVNVMVDLTYAYLDPRVQYK